MRELPYPFSDWLPDVAADPIHVDESKAGLNEEARANHWAFGLTAELARNLSADDVTAFVRAVEDAKERQILARFGELLPMVLYGWHSAQTAKLNVSLVSRSHGRLPFEAAYEIVEELREIAEEFIADPYHEDIRLAEFREVLQEELEEYESRPRILRVWTSLLPKDVP